MRRGRYPDHACTQPDLIPTSLAGSPSDTPTLLRAFVYTVPFGVRLAGRHVRESDLSRTYQLPFGLGGDSVALLSGTGHRR